MEGEKEEGVPKQTTEEWETYSNKTPDAAEQPTSSWFPWRKKVKVTEERVQGTAKQNDSGETSTKSHEYWANVWKDVHGSGAEGSIPKPDCKMRKQWKTLQKEGKTNEEIFEIMKRDNPEIMVWLPFFRNAENFEGKSRAEIKEHFIKNIKEFQIEAMTPEQKNLYEQMKGENKENEFWKKYWEQIHKDGHYKKVPWRKMMHRRGPWSEEERSESSESTGEASETRGYHGHHHHHRHWGIRGSWKWHRCGQKDSNEKSFYKEFDFVN